MVGIYLIKNKLNQKVYIGQSKDIENRFKEHFYHNQTLLDKDIRLYGKDNFEFIILQECSIDQLDLLEEKYIKLYNAVEKGYNLIQGGQHNIGESNPNVKITENDVYNIREYYNAHFPQLFVYNTYADRLTWNYFLNLWEGRAWPTIHMDVYTSENISYYSNRNVDGTRKNSNFTDIEIMDLRQQYKYSSAKDLYKQVNGKCDFQTFQQILWGRYYKDLPVYSKKTNDWNFRLNPVSTISVKESTSTIGT